MAPTDWRLRIDPDNVGVDDGWPERGLPADTLPAEVPGVWNTVVPGYAGVAWYEARSQPDLLFRGTIRLVIGGSNYLTDAWLNGVYLGRHEGGYDAFSFRCTDVIRRGENRVTLADRGPAAGGRDRRAAAARVPDVQGVVVRRVRRSVGRRLVRGDGRRHESGAVSRLDSRRPRLRRSAPRARDLPHHAGERPRDDGFCRPRADKSARRIVADDRRRSDRPGSSRPTPSRFRHRSRGRRSRPRCTAGTSGCVSRAQFRRISRWDGSGSGPAEWRDGVFYLNGEPRYLKGALLQPTYPRSLVAPTWPVHRVSH